MCRNGGKNGVTIGAVDLTFPPDAAKDSTPPEDSSSKARKKELKRLLEGSRPLDWSERYRALNDAMDEAYDLIDINNREARFALVLMGALNAAVLVVSTRTDLLQGVFGEFPIAVGGLLGLYAVTAVYFFLQAIEALRPGRFKPRLGNWSKDSDDYPMGVRYFEDVIQRDVVGYWRAWNEVQTGQLNAEIAIQVHSLCLKNNATRDALRRLFAGLRVMTVLVAGLLTLFVYATLNN